MTPSWIPIPAGRGSKRQSRRSTRARERDRIFNEAFYDYRQEAAEFGEIVALTDSPTLDIWRGDVLLDLRIFYKHPRLSWREI